MHFAIILKDSFYHSVIYGIYTSYNEASKVVKDNLVDKYLEDSKKGNLDSDFYQIYIQEWNNEDMREHRLADELGYIGFMKSNMYECTYD